MDNFIEVEFSLGKRVVNIDLVVSISEPVHCIHNNSHENWSVLIIYKGRENEPPIREDFDTLEKAKNLYNKFMNKPKRFTTYYFKREVYDLGDIVSGYINKIRHKKDKSGLISMPSEQDGEVLKMLNEIQQYVSCIIWKIDDFEKGEVKNG